MMTRHSTMIVGPTGGGKSVVIHTLAQSQTSLGRPTKLYTLNPKVSYSFSYNSVTLINYLKIKSNHI